jgi:hypothetical protein
MYNNFENIESIIKNRELNTLDIVKGTKRG